jgi:hypothetical protein
VFGLFGRRREESPAPRARPFQLARAETESAAGVPAEPEAQVQLVCETVEKLDEVRRLVSGLAELPVGDRHTLLAQLASTCDSLRSLYFLDAIY